MNASSPMIVFLWILDCKKAQHGALGALIVTASPPPFNPAGKLMAIAPISISHSLVIHSRSPEIGRENPQKRFMTSEMDYSQELA